GCSRPFARRSAAIGESSARVRYSTQSDISATDPDPTFPDTYGSAPSSSHRSMNSWVPNALSSTTSSQCELTIRGRLSRKPDPHRAGGAVAPGRERDRCDGGAHQCDGRLDEVPGEVHLVRPL